LTLDVAQTIVAVADSRPCESERHLLRYLSLFSGIEAASVAWSPLGWECVGFSEIEPLPCRVLAQRFPGVRNLGDVTKITEADVLCLGPLDIIIFGSPCQDLSVAGRRKGLAGERSGLFHVAIDIIQWARIHCGLRWALWENVPGAFSSNAGRDFAAVVEALAGVDVAVPPKGWGSEGCAVGAEGMVEWAVLDAQWFGLAQRRRRVFALADFGDWTRRPPVLLEPESVRGDSAPSRGTGQSVAGTLTRSLGERGAEAGERGLLHVSTPPVSMCLNAGGMGRIDSESETLLAYMPARTFGVDGSIEYFAERKVSDALHTASGYGNKAPLIAFSSKDYGGDAMHDLSPTLRAMGHGESHANAGGQVAVAYDFLGTPASEIAKEVDVHVPLLARKPGQFENSTVTTVMQGM
jgi:DNA (cytosine-5)-methyltransferase 1